MRPGLPCCSAPSLTRRSLSVPFCSGQRTRTDRKLAGKAGSACIFRGFCWMKPATPFSHRGFGRLTAMANRRSSDGWRTLRKTASYTVVTARCWRGLPRSERRPRDRSGRRRRSRIIVTGDKDLLVLGCFMGVGLSRAFISG